MRNLNEIEINNCYVSNYDITESATGFIHDAKKIEISNTTFYNNTVHSTTSSPVSPAYVIGTDSGSKEWDVTISACTFVRNIMNSSTLINVVNLFIFGYKFTIRFGINYLVIHHIFYLYVTVIDPHAVQPFRKI